MLSSRSRVGSRIIGKGVGPTIRPPGLERATTSGDSFPEVVEAVGEVGKVWIRAAALFKEWEKTEYSGEN